MTGNEEKKHYKNYLVMRDVIKAIQFRVWTACLALWMKGPKLKCFAKITM